jgi:ribonuclease P protein component
MGMSPEDGPSQRFTFGKIEKLCSKRSFDILLKERRAFYVGCLQVMFTLQHPTELAHSPVMIAITAPKRSFKRAVDRNLLKRRIREAYRLHKHPLWAALQGKDHRIAALIKYNVREIRSFQEIERDLQRAIKKLSDLL